GGRLRVARQAAGDVLLVGALLRLPDQLEECPTDDGETVLGRPPARTPVGRQQPCLDQAREIRLDRRRQQRRSVVRARRIELLLIDADDVTRRIGPGGVDGERIGEDQRDHVSLAVGVDGRKPAVGGNDGCDRRAAQVYFRDEERPRLGEAFLRDVELERLLQVEAAVV